MNHNKNSVAAIAVIAAVICVIMNSIIDEFSGLQGLFIVLLILKISFTAIVSFIIGYIGATIIKEEP